MNRFKILDSVAIEPDRFVFAGEIIEGKVGRGMKFWVPEAGHKHEFVVRSVEAILKKGGTELIGLVVENRTPSYLGGLGVGWTAELHEP